MHALELARAYLSVWEKTFASLIVEENYSQEVTEYRRGIAGRQPMKARRLRSELLLLRAPAENVWLSFRDVFQIDGRPIHDREKRFEALFSGPVAMMLSTAERIAEEGARFNLGRLSRTINTPSAGLVMLNPRYQANTKWDVHPSERIEGRTVWELRFNQRNPPFAVVIPTAAARSVQGRFWLEHETGAILRWELHVRAGVSTFRVRTAYGTVPSIREGRVPLRMQEEYDDPQLERLRGVALYSNHRLFRTAARIIAPGF